MPLQSTSGAASYDAFGGGVAAVPKYIEDYFSTFLYQGTGASNTINNGIDLSTKGGLVWIKQRNQAASHRLFDTVRGVQNSLASNSTAATASFSGYLTAFNTNGFTVGSANDVNESGFPLTSWSFAKAPKFFDVVTYTGNGSVQNIAHSLGSTPGCIIVKPTSFVENWFVYHTSIGATEAVTLNTTNASSSTLLWNNTAPTSTQFTVRSVANSSGETYVAYLFAHDAGGFGLTGTDNVISCGSYTGTGTAGLAVTLGYEPQWVLIKNASSGLYMNWFMHDNMRGMAVGAGDPYLYANASNSESGATADYINPTATGFTLPNTSQVHNESGSTYIYIAIRRGPMKVPTSGTSVFSVDYQGQYTPKPPGHTSGFVTDMALVRNKNTTNDMINVSRLTGDNYLITSSTAAAGSLSFIDFDYMNGWGDLSTTDANYYSWMFGRAPSFFDEVCYTGTGSARTLSHNLQAVPELILLKDRNNSVGWAWYYGVTNKWISMPGGSAPFTSSTIWNDTAPTSSVFSVGANSNSNASGTTYVAYLWASLAGVSKIGTYVGNGSSQTINCGFTSGARFVMVTNLTDGGRWQVVDTARGINSASDPVMRLDTTAAEITGEDPVDPDSSGFIVNVGGPDYTFINNSGTTYLYLAIA